MRRSFPFLAVALLFALPGTAHAQEEGHIVSAEDLDAIALAHADESEGRRAELRAFLQRPEVRDIAADAGIDIGTAESAVAVMTPDDARRLSGQLAQVDAALAGGDTIVISTTAIIIALLIVIVLLVA